MRDGEPTRKGRAAKRELPVVLAAGALAVLLLASPRQAAESNVLESFLREGPEPGRWEIASFMGVRRYLYGPDPRDPQCRMLVPETGAGPDGEGAPEARVVPLKRAAQWFVPGCRQRFVRNYRIAERLEDGDHVVVVWRPRAADRGDTQRRVWIDPSAATIRRLEDRAANGEVILSVRHLGPLPPEGLPDAGDAEATRACLDRAAWERRHLPSLEAVQEEAPFRVLEPTFLPAGFGLKEAAYRKAGEDPGVVWLTFTDGLATFALVLGPPESVAAFEERFGRSKGSAKGPDGDGEKTCGRQGEAGTGQVRCHHAPRRIVLRIDDLHGLEVLLLGRNELPEAEYVRVLRGLVPMAAPKAPGR